MTAADPRDGLDKRLGFALVRVLQEDYEPIRELARSLEITFIDGEPCIAHARPEAVDEVSALQDIVQRCFGYEHHRRMTDYWRPAFATIRHLAEAALTPDQSP